MILSDQEIRDAAAALLGRAAEPWASLIETALARGEKLRAVMYSWHDPFSETYGCLGCHRLPDEPHSKRCDYAELSR